jgi:hypothetical protein
MPNTTTLVEDAVQVACRAPSYHNSQPWRWVFTGGELRLFVDVDRLVATDRAGRQALLSCGAALHHLRVAVAGAGVGATVVRHPNPDDHQHIASIRFGGRIDVTPADSRRADAILARRTDRLPLAAPTEWTAFEHAMRTAVGRCALVDVVVEDDRPLLAEASALTDSLRLYDSAYHAEMQWWTAPFGIDDGIPPSALISAAESDRVSVGRTFPVIANRERRPQIDEDASTIVVLSAVHDSRRDVLACGEALSAVLLEATAAGLATGTLTHVTEVGASRDVVTSLTGRPYPQVLVRVGVAPVLEEVPAPTPRRPLAEVLTFAPQ